MNPFVKPALPAFYLTRSAQAVESPMLTRLREERATALQFVEQTVSGAETQSRDLSTTELETLERSKKRVAELDAQIKPLAEFDALRAASAAASNQFRPTQGGQAGQGTSAAFVSARAFDYQKPGQIFADCARAIKDGDVDARARLESAGLTIIDNTLVRATAPNQTTDEVPGLMPKAVIGSILSDIDASRPFIQSIGAQDMGNIPGRTFTRPYVKQHVTTGQQDSELDELENRQLIIKGTDFTKVTRGGWANISYQTLNYPVGDVWQMLLQDFMDVYGQDSEDAAVAAFDAAVPTASPIDLTNDPTLKEIIKVLYAGARAVYAVRRNLTKLCVWQSLDEWEVYGAVIDEANAKGNTPAVANATTFSSPQSMLGVPRVVVPGLPDGTTIIGSRDRVEVYENRYGFLSAVQPKVIGIELAYGGDIATGVLKPDATSAVAFTRIVRATV